MMAIRRGHRECVSILVAHGADVNMVNEVGMCTHVNSFL